MNKMQDREVRHMAVFKLRQVERQLIELETCAESAATRGCLISIRAALRTAAEVLQGPVDVVVDGDDEARLAAR